MLISRQRATHSTWICSVLILAALLLGLAQWRVVKPAAAPMVSPATNGKASLASSSRPNEAMPSFQGQPALAYLKQRGLLESVKATVGADRHKMQWRPERLPIELRDAGRAHSGGTWQANNPGQNLRASFSRAGVLIAPRRLIVNNAGLVRANVIAKCNASDTSFTIKVTDSGGLSDSATLPGVIAVNAPPTLGNYSTTTINLHSGSNALVLPNAQPLDNGTIGSLTVSASPGFTGSLSVNQVTGKVMIANAKPLGNYTVTVKAVDDCGAIASSAFTLRVKL